MNLIKEKVRKMQELTTVSIADRGTEYRGGTFSVSGAIEKQVEYEDTVRYFSKPVEPFTPVPELPDQGKPSVLSLYRFIGGILP